MLATFPDYSYLAVCRFICSIVLQAYLEADACQGMSYMKFAVNHPYRFIDYFQAYYCGLL